MEKEVQKEPEMPEPKRTPQEVYRGLKKELLSGTLRDREKGFSKEEIGAIRLVLEQGTSDEKAVAKEIFNEGVQTKNPDWFE